MPIHPQAGQPAGVQNAGDIQLVTSAYVDDWQNPVKFGTSGHRGRSLDGSFQESHIAAITQAVCDYRARAGITGPIFVGRDTHALSELAITTAVEVLSANGASVILQSDDAFVATPVISRAILEHNAAHPSAPADGLIITPSHNPPEDGGLKYNPPHGGPAGSEVTSAIESRANELIGDWRSIARTSVRTRDVQRQDLNGAYIEALPRVVNVALIAQANIRIGVDPLGGASIDLWQRIADRFKLGIEVVNDAVDPAFGFMCRDHDGKIRMDCSSPHAMAGLIQMRDRFDLAIGNDPDADRHGIVANSGLMNPNHFLSLATDYLIGNRSDWPSAVTIGKTVVTSALMERVAIARGRSVLEVPVGFKWFAEPMHRRECVFAGEESAGASLAQFDGSPWCTDKDGVVMGLLAAEMLVTKGRDLGEQFDALTEEFGRPHYVRVDRPASDEVRATVGSLSPADVNVASIAGDPVLQVLSHAPGNGAAIGGVKLVTQSGWMAARPSGTEAILKVYAESFRDAAHLEALVAEGSALVDDAAAQAASR